MDCPPESRLCPNSFWKDEQELFGVRKVDGFWKVQLSDPLLRGKLYAKGVPVTQVYTRSLKEIQDFLNISLAQIGHPPLTGWKRQNRLWWTRDRKYSLNGDEGWRIVGFGADGELFRKRFKTRKAAHQYLLEWRAKTKL